MMTAAVNSTAAQPSPRSPAPSSPGRRPGAAALVSMACCFTDMVPARSPNRSRGLLRRESVADAAARSAIGPTVPPHWTRPAGTHPWGLDRHHSPVMYRYEVVLPYRGRANFDVGL